MDLLTVLVVMLSVDASSLSWSLLDWVTRLRQMLPLPSPRSRRVGGDPVRLLGSAGQDPARVDGVR